MFAPAVYPLCALASLACMLLLGRAYWRSRARLLLSSAICFVGLAINNLLLFIDLVVLPQIDLSLPRLLASFGGVAVLIAAMIWESER
jgi:hydrogenase/urease accessory protein HupE